MSTKAAIDRLVDIIVRLRGGNGCPWDRQQTPGSMIRYMIEEVYELAEAVDTGNPDDIRDELGDVLFHILFMARMFEEKEDFGIDDVLRTIAAKMVRRHPHVFGSGEVKDSDDVVRKWHEIKRSESSGRAGQSVLDSVPSRLPALMRAYKISARAARSRFDWNTLDDVLKKLEEELAEFKAALAEGNALSVNDELGDMFFTLVNVARLAGIHPDTALSASSQKFENRFRQMETIIAESGRKLESVPQSEKDVIWDAVKRKEIDV